MTKNNPSQKTHEEDVRIWRELAVSGEDVFYGTDEVGRTGWFLRLTMTGMYPRRVGPYANKEEAIKLLNEAAAEFALDTLIDVQNAMELNQACVVEGVPRLTATV